MADTGGGLVFREGDAHDLAAKLALLLGDKQLATTYARRGRRCVLENYTWAAVARKLHEVIVSVADR